MKIENTADKKLKRMSVNEGALILMKVLLIISFYIFCLKISFLIQTSLFKKYL